MARLYNTFEFVGNIQIPKDQNRFHKLDTYNSGWEKHTLNFAIQESKTNSVFLELSGGFSKAKANKVFSFSKGTENKRGSKLEIPWDDRLKPETVDMVADFKKTVVDYTNDFKLKEELNLVRYEINQLEYKDELTSEEQARLFKLQTDLVERDENRFEFIHEYDAINYIAGTIAQHKDSKFRIKGSIEFSEWKGKYYRKFKPELIEIVPNDEPSKLRANLDVFFTKDAIDETDLKEDKKIYINAFVQSYDNREKKDMFFPQQFIINAQKVDFENEMHVGRLNFIKNQFNVKGKGVYHLQWEVNIFRGAETVEFTYDDLTQKQKEAIEFGMSSIDDYKPKNGLLGGNIEENRLVKPVLKKVNDSNDFSEGASETEFTLEDLEYVSTYEAPEKLPVTEVPNDPFKEEPKKEIDINEELDDLFA